MADESTAPGLREIFLGEFGEQLRAMSTELLALESAPDDAERLRALFRIVHTLKGAGSVAGVPLVAACCHGVETLLAHVRGGTRALRRPEFDILFATIDALDDARRRLAAGGALVDSPLERLVRSLRDDSRTNSGPLVPAETAELAPAAANVAGASAAPTRETQVRVPTERLDALRVRARRLVVAERRVQARVQEMAALLEAGAAPRGGSRGAAQVSASDRVRDVERLVRDVAADARALGTATMQVAEIADRLRARALRDATQPLARVVRDAAATTGKLAQLVVTGDDVEVDRIVLDALREALPHLARNAVDHGIEPRAARRHAGKSESGTVTVTAAIRGRKLTVTVADDGAGIDVAAVRAQLARRRATVPDQSDAVLAAVFESGLSTRAEPTATSGRGVGLDAVRETVARVGGSVRVESSQGQGTSLTLTCPLDLSLVRVLVFSAAQRLLAVPSAVVERLIRLDPDRIGRSQDRSVVTVPDVPAPVPIVSLGRLFGTGVGGLATIERNAVVLAAGGRRVAIAATELLSEEELVVRPVPHVDATVPYLGGAALVGERVALMLDASALVDAGLALASTASAPEPPVAARKRILVVDDSITTRTLHRTLLEGVGYEVETAVDGAAAWRLLEAEGADLVVADVQMPGMDGFALCEAIRRSSRFRELPVVLVTSAESPEHRTRGLEAGADAYLGKSSFDQGALLETIRELLEDR